MTIAPARSANGHVGQVNLAMNAMRFLAALFVLINHIRPLFFVDYADTPQPGAFTAITYALTSLGHQAVVIFFVLSGYWVGGSTLQGFRSQTFSARNYAIARAVRLWIVLIPAIVLTQTADRLGTALWPTSEVYSGSAAYHTVVPLDGAVHHLDLFTTVANALFLMDIHSSTLGTDTPLWSLAAEFWYYLLFPAALMLLWRGSPLRSRGLGAIVIIVALAVLLLPTVHGHTNVLGLFPAWLAGAAVAATRNQFVAAFHCINAPTVLLIRASLLFAVAGCAAIDSRSGNLMTAYALAIATALLTGSLITDVQSRFGRAILSPLSWAAEWSYSLYASHMPILAFLCAAVVPLSADRWQLTPGTAALGLLIALGPILTALAFYFAFERNTNSIRRALQQSARLRFSKSLQAD